MRPLRTLIIYFFVVFLGGALLAPWFYRLVQTAATSFPKLAQWFADVPFHRVVSRLLWLLALAGLRPLLCGLGARSARDLGLVSPAGQWRKIGAGFLLGFVSLAVLAALALAGSASAIRGNLTLSRIIEKIVSAALTGITVGTLEEILFRGGIFGGLRRVFDWRVALGLSSGVYALVHFFARPRFEGEVTWASGLVLLPQMVAGFADWRVLVPGFFNLTLVGVLLGLAYQRTGDLYFSIGLHTGWIFWLKSYRALTSGNPDANIWFWGSGRMIDGWLAFAVLFITLVVFLRMQPAAKPRPAV